MVYFNDTMTTKVVDPALNEESFCGSWIPADLLPGCSFIDGTKIFDGLSREPHK